MLNKFVNSLKKNGLLKTIKKVIIFIYYKLLTIFSIFSKKNILKNVNFTEFDIVIIFENNFGWEKIMKQRPQQIAENFKDNVLFIYHSYDNNDYKNKKRIRKIKKNLYIIDLGYYRDLLINNLANHNNKYLMVYSTDYIPLERIKFYKNYRYKLIYDYVDDIDEDLCGKLLYKKLYKNYKNIVNDDTNIIISTADRLYNNIIKENSKANVHLVTNGVCYENFQIDPSTTIPKDLKSIVNKYDHIIGYYGALAKWFDYSMIKYISSKRPKDAIVLIGLDYDNSLKKSKILDLDNVFFLGKKNYDELPNYVKYFDVCTIPFLINNITLSTSPVKLFEYMAAHKPIVTTAMPECKKYDVVLISKNKEEFNKNIDKAIKLGNDSNYLKKLNEVAMNNTWIKKCESISGVLDNDKNRITKLQELLTNRLESEEIERIIVWRSPFGWDVPLFQRPQHISNSFSKMKSLVLYEVLEKTDNIVDFGIINDNLYLINFTNQMVLDAVSCIIDRYPIPRYLQIYSTNWEMSVETLQLYIDSGYKVIYEYIDELSPDLAGTNVLPPNIIKKYNLMIKNKKNILVVVTASRIETDILNKRGKENYCFACNGVNYDHFINYDKNYKIEDNIMKIINNGKINVGYYGALANWMDYELIKKINSTNKYNIILFGIKYDNAFDNSKIERLENVYYFGSKKYEVLPCYASKLDILTIPFLINDITNATSPLKLFEYMALHKPIVTTAMPECQKYKSVLIAFNHDEFLNKLVEATELRTNKEYIKKLDHDALANSWDSKAIEIIKMLKKNEK